jgi:hypothetical protein
LSLLQLSLLLVLLLLVVLLLLLVVVVAVVVLLLLLLLVLLLVLLELVSVMREVVEPLSSSECVALFPWNDGINVVPY